MVRVDRVELSYLLTFTAPFHLGTGLRQGLVHRTVSRDVEGYLYVPGSTLKGALRERCTHLARLFNLNTHTPHDTQGVLVEFSPTIDIIGRIFGSRIRTGELYFDDARMIQEDRAYFDGVQERKKYQDRQVQERTQVGISRLTRSSRPGLLYTSEFGASQLRFAGEIYGRLRDFELPSNPRGTYSLLLLLAGMHSLDRLGANRSSGAGRLICDITGLNVNGENQQAVDWLASLTDLEYYDIEREGTGP